VYVWACVNLQQAAAEGGDEFLMNVFNDPLLLGQVIRLFLLDVVAVVGMDTAVVFLMHARCLALPRWLQLPMMLTWIGAMAAMRMTRGQAIAANGNCSKQQPDDSAFVKEYKHRRKQVLPGSCVF